MTIDVEVFLIGVVLVPLLTLWAMALFHIIARRPDLSISWKGIWSVIVVVLPFVGVLFYGMLRPPRPPKRTGTDDPSAVGRALEQLQQITQARLRGDISEASAASKKAEIFGLTDSTA